MLVISLISFKTAFSAIQEEDDTLSVVICDLSGKLVRTLADEFQHQGSYLVEWDGTDNNYISVKPGIYISILIADDIKISQKLVLIR
jgi:flagellar hook assembly protein FlgD